MWKGLSHRCHNRIIFLFFVWYYWGLNSTRPIKRTCLCTYDLPITDTRNDTRISLIKEIKTSERWRAWDTFYTKAVLSKLQHQAGQKVLSTERHNKVSIKKHTFMSLKLVKEAMLVEIITCWPAFSAGFHLVAGVAVGQPMLHLRGSASPNQTIPNLHKSRNIIQLNSILYISSSWYTTVLFLKFGIFCFTKVELHVLWFKRVLLAWIIKHITPLIMEFQPLLSTVEEVSDYIKSHYAHPPVWVKRCATLWLEDPPFLLFATK